MDSTENETCGEIKRESSLCTKAIITQGENLLVVVENYYFTINEVLLHEETTHHLARATCGRVVKNVTDKNLSCLYSTKPLLANGFPVLASVLQLFSKRKLC